MTNPLELPADDWGSWLARRVDTELAAARAGLDAIKDGSDRTTPGVLALWNDADVALANAGDAAGLFAEVHPSAEVRAQAEKAEQEIRRLITERDLDGGLYAVLAATTEDGLDDAARRFREHVLRDFRRSGVDRPEEVRARLKEIAERLTVVDQDFARAIREDVRTMQVSPENLDGLPADYVAAHPAGDDGLVTLTTDYPDYIPFRTFATDAAARRELTTAFLNRAHPVNDAVLHEMLALRDEQARLLGFANWPDYDADVKMVGSGKAIGEFVEKLSGAALDAGRRDYAMLLDRRRRDEPDAAGVDAADSAFYLELIRRENFGVDAQEVRQYFEFSRVRKGLLDVTAALFGVEYFPILDAPVWHEDVTVYDVMRAGVKYGRIYLDLQPRDGKFKHAAQFVLVPGVAGVQLPEGVLVCNFTSGVMEHSDVTTLFHEFGHLVHHILGGHQKWARFSGVATEWDFVEAPSQMLEEWAWDPDVLQTFARDEIGHPIPRDLVARMRAANNFGSGLFVRTQLFYTAVSYQLHQELTDDLLAVVKQAQAKYDLFQHIEGTHFTSSFGHLAGYTSAYYTYMWSLVIAKDLFSAFDPANLLAPGIAHRYRDGILAPGGSRDAADLVQDFLGRPFGFDAFQAWLDAAPVPVE